MLTGQTDACRKHIEALTDKYADAESELILAGLLVREKELNEAITVLQSVAEKSLNVSLTLCQRTDGAAHLPLTLYHLIPPASSRFNHLLNFISFCLTSDSLCSL